MAKKFKDYYGKDTAQLIASKIAQVSKVFDDAKFVDHIVSRIKGKEFLERQDIFAQAIETYLKGSYKKQIDVLLKILGPELQTDTGMFTYGYWLWPIGRFVERNGLKDHEVSCVFIYELTKRFTGEFAIRPLLEAYPKEITAVMEQWSKDESVHVRRLASEGVRPTLPWAKKLNVYENQWSTYKKILSNLRHDQSKFVQKSVGNNLNDVYKINPSQAFEIIEKWRKGKDSKAMQWIINHGLRSTKKKKK